MRADLNSSPGRLDVSTDEWIRTQRQEVKIISVPRIEHPPEAPAPGVRAYLAVLQNHSIRMRDLLEPGGWPKPDQAVYRAAVEAGTDAVVFRVRDSA